MDIKNWVKRHSYGLCGGAFGSLLGILVGTCYCLNNRIDDVDSDLKSALSNQKKEFADSLLGHQQEDAKNYNKHEAEIGQIKARLNSAEDRLTAIEDTLSKCPCNDRAPAHTPVAAPARRTPRAGRVNNTVRDTVVVRDTLFMPIDTLPVLIDDEGDTSVKPDTVAASRDTVVVMINNKEKKIEQNGNGIVINGNNNNITIYNNSANNCEKQPAVRDTTVAPQTTQKTVVATVKSTVTIFPVYTRKNYCR